MSRPPGASAATAERIAQYQALHAAGSSYAQIGALSGISKQAVHALVHREPDGRRYRGSARYARTHGRCARCFHRIHDDDLCREPIVGGSVAGCVTLVRCPCAPR